MTSLAAGTARVRGWWAGRGLRVRLLAGVLAVLVVVLAVIGVATAVALRGFLMSRLDQQLVQSGQRPTFGFDARGEQVGTLQVLFDAGQLAGGGMVQRTGGSVTISPADERALQAVARSGGPSTVDLSAYGPYRLQAFPGPGDQVLVVGLPMTGVNATLHRLEAVDVLVFAAGVLLVGVLGSGWVGWSLGPLRRVAATAREVARLPLASGEVALPAGVPVDDPRTEVGQVGEAFNAMLAHVTRALASRQASEARLRQFVADASHELRTPLASIRGHTELARRYDERLPEDVSRALGRVDAESRRMGRLVEDLLLLARLDTGRPLATAPVDLTRLAIDATADAQAAAADHRWVLDLPAEPVVVDGDGDRLHQVLTNLLSNAAHHTPAGTTVRVGVGVSADAEAELWVLDDGPGIPPVVADRVFERFVRADTSRSRATGSTGLGLAIVAAVVHAHHGTVSVDSRPGRTCFRVRLPGSAQVRGDVGGEQLEGVG